MKTKFLGALLAMLCAVMASNAQSYTIYYDNSVTQWSSVGIHYWGDISTTWPGVEIDHVEGDVWAYTFPSDPSGLDGFLFKHAVESGDS